LEAAGFTAGAGFAAVVVLVLPEDFLVECLCTLFTGFLVAAGAAEVAAGAAGFAGVLCAGGFCAANIVVEAIAKAIVSKVFFMAFFFSLASLVVRSPYNSMVRQMGELNDSLRMLGRGTNWRIAGLRFVSVVETYRFDRGWLASRISASSVRAFWWSSRMR
jgi:hypothetical protein